jgi:hypothetical protein
MKNFDDIIKDVKSKVKSTGGSSKSKRDVWQDLISALMSAAIQLNNMYDKADEKHHVHLEPCNCERCGKVIFIIFAEDIDDSTKAMRFHPFGCTFISTGVYRCAKCK